MLQEDALERSRFVLWPCRRRSQRCSRRMLWSWWTSQSRVLQPVVPGKEGDGGCWWPIIDLLALHGFVTLTKLKMGTVASLLGSVRKGDWMFSIDLRDAYFQIPAPPESWPYLRFVLKGVSTSSMPSVSVCLQPSRFSPESLLWCRSGHPGGPFCCSWFSSCARIWGSLSTIRSPTSSHPLVSSI